jgi:hypothetical protein
MARPSVTLFYSGGEDTVIEAAQPLPNSTAEGRELDQFGKGIAVTFKTRACHEPLTIYVRTMSASKPSAVPS